MYQTPIDNIIIHKLMYCIPNIGNNVGVGPSTKKLGLIPLGEIGYMHQLTV